MRDGDESCVILYKIMHFFRLSQSLGVSLHKKYEKRRQHFVSL